MNSAVKAGLALIVGAILVGLMAKLIWILVPVAGLLGLGMVVYGATAGKKSLGDGRRRLP